ncbi:helix-turn-helix transcriptional regulator [Rhizobium laguerreae]|nr:helix-turn-helix transcriptional regulator [Rhizobium laguerreae]
MAGVYWAALADIAAMPGEDISPGGMETADASLAATAETIADLLPTASVEVLREGFAEASGALSRLRKIGVNDQSPEFIAGRLAAIVDILGYAVAVTADEEVVEKAAQPKYRGILEALLGEPLRDLDLSVKIGEDIAFVSTALYDLREIGLITSHRRGIEVYNDLTPLGRIAAEG